MTKETLRKQALRMRQSMSVEDFQAKSQLITCLILESVDFSRLRILHSFLPMVTRREPDLWPLLDDLRKNQSALQIAVPRIKGRNMESILLEKETKFNNGAFGISEPEDGKAIDHGSIDLVFVPVLVADAYGNRLGYGKGFYDRFLTDCRKDCVKIGISILEPFASVPTEPHDIRLDRLVSPSGILTFE